MAGLAAGVALALACGDGVDDPAGPTSSPAPPTSAPSVPLAPVVEPWRIPLGDGKISTSPLRGSVFSCQTQFMGGGAFRDGPWIKADGTWDSIAKAIVDGEVSSVGRLEVREDAARRIVETSGLPDHPTGVYPVAPEDDAFQYDRNPNRITAQRLRFSLPLDPTPAAQPSCLPLGPVGVFLTGAVYFNALDARGKDAVAHELQDRCHGHPERTGVYHYHDLTPCLGTASGGHSRPAGYALDGFGIFGLKGEGGRDMSNTLLDECHGHTHEIDWDGRRVGMYHYHATLEYPYTLGCFRGTPVRNMPGP